MSDVAPVRAPRLGAPSVRQARSKRCASANVWRRFQRLCFSRYSGHESRCCAQDAAKGSMLLADARKAIGGDDKLAAVKRLQVSGTFLRSTGPDQIIDGDFDVFIELPDKYRRNEITGFAGTNVERSEILNGDQVSDQSSGGLSAAPFSGWRLRAWRSWRRRSRRRRRRSRWPRRRTQPGSEHGHGPAGCWRRSMSG